MKKLLLLSVCLFVFSTISEGQKLMWRTFSQGISVADYDAGNVRQLVPPSRNGSEDMVLDTINNWFYLVNGRTIQRINKDGSNPQVILSERTWDIRGVALDMVRNKIYYTREDEKIFRVNFDGTSKDTIMEGLGDLPSKIAVDPFGKRIYWSNIFTDDIYMAGLNGENPRIIYRSDDYIRNLQVDLKNQKLYWLDTSDKHPVMEANLNGGGIRVAFDPPERMWAIYFHLDQRTGKFYLIELVPDRIHEYDPKTRTLRTIREFERRAHAICVDDEQIYWDNSGDIYRGSLSENDEELITSDETTLGTFVLDKTRKRLVGVDNDGRIVSTDAAGNIVRAHTGVQPTRISDIFQFENRLYLVDDRKMGSCNLDGSDYRKFLSKYDFGSVKMTFDPAKRKIYFATTNNQIWQCDLNGGDLKKILDYQDNTSYSFRGIAYSSTNERLYIANFLRSGLVSVKTDGTDFRTEYSESGNIYASYPVVDDVHGFVYYRQGSNGYIYKIDLNSGVRSVYLQSVSDWDSPMYDPEDDVIYALDSDLDAVIKITSAGSEIAFVDAGNHQVSLGLTKLPSGEFVYGINDDFILKKSNPTTGEFIRMIHKSPNWFDALQLDEAKNDLYGITADVGYLYKINLDTDEMTRFHKTERFQNFVLFPENQTMFINSYDKIHLLKSNFVTGKTDTIYTRDNGRASYRDLRYNSITNRIYFCDTYERNIMSIDTSGADLRAETSSNSLNRLIGFNPNDSSFVVHEGSGFQLSRIKIGSDSTVDLKPLPIDFQNNFQIVDDNFFENMDADGDGFTILEDCDDSNPNIYPGATEIPNNVIDENCDGIIALIDADGDGFGSDVDCDDNDPAINPNADDIPNNDIDEDCDGDALVIDNDNDGYNSDEDCNDNAAWINPGATEIPNNFWDENCDGIVEVIDEDDDGFNSDEDCDDENPNVNPDADEILNNDIDENCDGIIAYDLDNDGFLADEDCDDENPDVNPDANEILNNDIDENCDGIVAYDLDNDGFLAGEDCDDENPDINPDADEIINNDIDENCDGIAEEIDEDNDGYNSDEDCDDTDPFINPGAPEIPNNDVDENCDGVAPIIDEDNDGFHSYVDCDDENPDINPDAVEIPNNGIDENCDGIVDSTTSVTFIDDIKISVFPNPFSEILNIELSEYQRFNYTLSDISGKVLRSGTLSGGVQQLDLKGILAGVYFLKIQAKNLEHNGILKVIKI